MDNQLRKEAEQFKDICSREIVLRKPSVNDDSRSIRGVIATELPVIVMDWYKWEPVREVLVIDGGNIPDKIPLLDTHSRFEINNIKGSVTNFDYEADNTLGMILTGDNIFSKTAEKEFTLAKEGHLDSTSIGYRVYSDQTVEVPAGGSIDIDGRTFKNDYQDKLPLYIRKKWDLLENSLVPIGADKAAKFRSMFTNEPAEQKTIVEEIREAVKDETSKQLKIIINKEGQNKMDENKEKLEAQRIKGIDDLAKKFQSKVTGLDLNDQAELFKAGGKTEVEFSDLILERIKEQSSVNKPYVELTPKEIKLYDPMRAIRSAFNKTRSFETEISDEFSKQSGQSPQGIYLPHNALLPNLRLGKRDLLAGTSTSASELVGTDHLGAQFIDYLYEKMVLNNVVLMPNQKGNIEIPVLNASAGHGWAATEAAVLAEGAPTVTEKTASPKRGGRYIDMSKMLMIQSDPSAEAVFLNDLLKSLALGVQSAILNGTGASGQPTGLKLTSGIGDAGSLASMDWAKAVEFETLIDDNFGDDKQMYYVTRRSHRGVLKSRAKESGHPQYICENNVVNGYEVRTSNLVTSGDVFFGDFSQILVPMWGAVDVIIDPYSQATYGLVRITANQLLDVIVRYAAAFSYGDQFS